jgi:hypothetical protein
MSDSESHTLEAWRQQTTVFALDSPTGDENSYTANWKSGWHTVSDLGNNNLIRRLNIDYGSSDSITAKIYTDENDMSPVATKTFSSTGNINTVKSESIRLGIRCRYFMIAIESVASVSSDARIDKIEVSTDG